MDSPLTKSMSASGEPARAGSRSDRLFLPICLLVIGAVYLLLHGIYRPENMDDAWYLSFARHFITRGVESDVCLGVDISSGGYSGVTLFGKTYAFCYGAILERFGWTKSNAHLISAAVMALSAVVWAGILRTLRFSRRLAAWFALSLLLAEPFFGAANQARPDALCFLLASFSLLLFLRGQPAAAGFVGVMSFEVHPAGIVSFLYLLGAAGARLRSPPSPSMKAVLRTAAALFAGVALGALYYIALHYAKLNLLLPALFRGNTGGGRVGAVLFEYFFKTKYYRHLPELFLFSGCLLWFFGRKYYRENAFIPAFLAAGLLITVVIRRPNFMYMIYIYPAFLLLLLWLFERIGRLNLIAAGILLYLLPQYAVAYRQNRGWDMEAYVAGIRDSVPNDGRPVVGGPNDWFAFQDRSFYAANFYGDFMALGLAEFYLIEGKDRRGDDYLSVRRVIEANYQKVGGGEVSLWVKKRARFKPGQSLLNSDTGRSPGRISCPRPSPR